MLRETEVHLVVVDAHEGLDEDVGVQQYEGVPELLEHLPLAVPACFPCCYQCLMRHLRSVAVTLELHILREI